MWPRVEDVRTVTMMTSGLTQSTNQSFAQGPELKALVRVTRITTTTTASTTPTLKLMNTKIDAAAEST